MKVKKKEVFNDYISGVVCLWIAETDKMLKYLFVKIMSMGHKWFLSH